ncbi:MAG TPA: serine/threonine-protein kinase [Ktedonobacteraceae bacterium]|nr:serine/threonine-protein kinase [Ktedonobacteraceae bacterium]
MSTEPRYLGKYELRERLARGGQGEVWKAFDTQLRRYVAIKQLHADLQSDPDFVSRFEREARFIASLHHPNIMQIHDFQLLPATGSRSSTAYMVMDYVEGQTLADYIRNTSRKMQFPSAADIVYIFTAVSLALDYAHGRGMIHRDIKPANIMLDQRSTSRHPLGEPTLMDFGIAKLQGAGADTTKILGTPLYVSPEQAQGRAGDNRSDLYSLGIILYEMTTGVTPFRGDSLMVILMQHLQQIPTPPALINPDIPPALSEVILKSIAKEPDARFPSAAAMTIAIAEALNVPVPPELRTPITPSESRGMHSYNPLQPSLPLGITPIPSAPVDFQGVSPVITPPPAYLPPAHSGNNRQAALTTPVAGWPDGAALPNAGLNTPQSAPPVPPPARLFPRQRKTLYKVLLALLVVIVAGSGLLYAYFTVNKVSSTIAPNTVVGKVSFLSVSSPGTAAGTINELQITIPHAQNAPSHTHFYAWLLTGSENVLPRYWLLPAPTSDGNLTFTKTDSQLLANNPTFFLITAESSNTGSPSFIPSARFYYATLTSPIKQSTPFDIRTCPQDSTQNVCFSY